MKRLSFLPVLFSGILLFSSCGDNSPEEANGLENNFHIEGQITGAANQKLKIEAQSQQGAIEVAQTVTDGSGNFELDGNIPGMGIYSITLGENTKNAVVIPMDVNDQVVLKASKETFAITPSFSGTKWAKPLTRYMELFSEFAAKQMEQIPNIKDQEKQIEVFSQLKKPLVAFAQKQIRKDPSNPVNIILMSLVMPSQETGFSDWDPANLEDLRKMESEFQRDHADSPITGMISQQIAQIDAQYQGYQQYNS